MATSRQKAAYSSGAAPSRRETQHPRLLGQGQGLVRQELGPGLGLVIALVGQIPGGVEGAVAVGVEHGGILLAEIELKPAVGHHVGPALQHRRVVRDGSLPRRGGILRRGSGIRRRWGRSLRRGGRLWLRGAPGQQAHRRQQRKQPFHSSPLVISTTLQTTSAPPSSMKATPAMTARAMEDAVPLI